MVGVEGQGPLAKVGQTLQLKRNQTVYMYTTTVRETETNYQHRPAGADLGQPHHEQVRRLFVVELSQIAQHPCKPGVVGARTDQSHAEYGVPTATMQTHTMRVKQHILCSELLQVMQL